MKRVYGFIAALMLIAVGAVFAGRQWSTAEPEERHADALPCGA